MCWYTVTWYFCAHSTFINADSIETCANRTLSSHSADAWSIDMCQDLKVTDEGLSNWYCPECSEDVTLEYEREDL